VAAAALDTHRERGTHAEGEDVAARYGPAETLPDSTPHRLLLYSRGLFRLATGKVGDALQDLREFERRDRDCHVLASHLTAIHTALTHTLVATGATIEAQAEGERAVADAAAWGAARSLGLALRAQAASLPPAAAVTVLHEALDVQGGDASEIDRGWVEHDLGLAHARLGQRGDASSALHRALDLAGRCGAGYLASRARTRLVELGFRPRRDANTGIDALTGSQRRVAELAAQGLSNREIAQALFVTVRTVEVHLTATYRKLGLTARKQLRTALAPRDPRPQ
jgi:DNA-binding CsgD family transcriptional regulator